MGSQSRRSFRDDIVLTCQIAIAFVCFLTGSIHAQYVRQSFDDFLHESFSGEKIGETLAEPALTAAYSQYVSKPAGLDSGVAGYGQHYGVAVADNVNGKFMRKFIFAAASGRLDHYSTSKESSFKLRLLNVLAHSVFSNPESADKSFNWSGLPASIVTAALSNAINPHPSEPGQQPSSVIPPAADPRDNQQDAPLIKDS